MIRSVLILACAWTALAGEVSVGGAVFAVVLGGAVSRFARPLGPYPVFARLRPLKLAGFALFVAWEIVVANLRVAAAVLGPQRLLRPAIVAVPLEVTRDDEIALLANLISLTPGTLSLDVSADRRTLYVHAMSTASPEALRREIKEGFERRLLEALR